MKLPADAFDFDPDHNASGRHTDFKKPYCCHCYRQLDPAKAIAVTANDETFIAVLGHGRAEEIRTNFNAMEMTGDAWIGKDCLRKLTKPKNIEHAGE